MEGTDLFIPLHRVYLQFITTHFLWNKFEKHITIHQFFPSILLERGVTLTEIYDHVLKQHAHIYQFKGL